MADVITTAVSVNAVVDSNMNVSAGLPATSSVDATLNQGLPVYAVVSEAVSGQVTLPASATVQAELNSSQPLTQEQRQIMEIKFAFKVAQDTYYTELTYDVDDNPTNIDVWTDNSKGTKLFSQVLTWVADQLTQSTVTDEQTSAVLTSTFGYTGDNITSITEALV